VANELESASFYSDVATLKARRGPSVEKYAIVRSNMKLYRFVPGNTTADDSDTTANSIAPSGGPAGRWLAIAFLQTAQAADVGALTDGTTGIATTTVSDVGASFSQTTLNHNFASLTAQLNSLRTALRASGVMA
jgi:hypothetical protein